MSEKPIFYFCKTCQKNYEGKKCPQCGKKGVPVHELPFERDLSIDASYFDHVMKNSKTKK